MTTRGPICLVFPKGNLPFSGRRTKVFDWETGEQLFDVKTITVVFSFDALPVATLVRINPDRTETTCVYAINEE